MPKFGHKVGHLSIYNVIKIFVNADFANEKPVLVSEGVANQLIIVFSVTPWIYYKYDDSIGIKTQLQS